MSAHFVCDIGRKPAIPAKWGPVAPQVKKNHARARPQHQTRRSRGRWSPMFAGPALAAWYPPRTRLPAGRATCAPTAAQRPWPTPLRRFAPVVCRCEPRLACWWTPVCDASQTRTRGRISRRVLSPLRCDSDFPSERHTFKIKGLRGFFVFRAHIGRKRCRKNEFSFLPGLAPAAQSQRPRPAGGRRLTGQQFPQLSCKIFAV